MLLRGVCVLFQNGGVGPIFETYESLFDSPLDFLVCFGEK